MKTVQRIMRAIVCLAIIISLCSCMASSSSSTKPLTIPPGDRIEGATIEIVRTATKLKTTPYTNIVLKDFEASKQIKTDYPDALTAYKTGLISMLREKKTFGFVDESPGQKHSGRTLLVDSTINDMRIASAAARTWAERSQAPPLWIFLYD